MTQVIDGAAVSEPLREALRAPISRLARAGVTPGLAAVTMNDDPATETYVGKKRRACADLGIELSHRRVDPGAPTEALLETVDGANEDPAVHGILIQLPLPDHVETASVRRCLDQDKDIDVFHPENLGRLVAGNPRYEPCTPRAIQRILSHAGVKTEGADVVIVGRSAIVGIPMLNMLLQKGPGGDATVTVCHSQTPDLRAKTRGADVVIAAAGVPELIDGEMLSPGVAVIDVGVNRIAADNERGYGVVGDVAFESARQKADVITPVPGGVGPMTVTMLLTNTVLAASAQADVSIDGRRDVSADEGE